MIDEMKYPHVAAFLRQHPEMTIDDAIAYFEHLEEDKNYLFQW